MSVGPLGPIVGSLAGSQQSQGAADTARVQQDVVRQERQIQGDRLAADAAGVAQADGQGHETNDRDADGRRPWEFDQAQPRGADETAPSEEGSRPSKDLSGQSGNQLDVSA